MTTKPTRSTLFVLAGIAFTALAVTACQPEGPAERAGKQIDQAADKVGDSVQNATDDAKDKIDDAKKK